MKIITCISKLGKRGEHGKYKFRQFEFKAHRVQKRDDDRKADDKCGNFQYIQCAVCNCAAKNGGKLIFCGFWGCGCDWKRFFISKNYSADDGGGDYLAYVQSNTEPNISPYACADSRNHKTYTAVVWNAHKLFTFFSADKGVLVKHQGVFSAERKSANKTEQKSADAIMRYS